MNRLIHYAILLVLLIGIYGAGKLSYRQLSSGSICPEIIGIPACYIILACFVVPFIAQLFDLSNALFFAGVLLAWSIAAYGSALQIQGVAECPKTEGGIPMCYISLGIFTSLILLKIIQRATG